MKLIFKITAGLSVALSVLLLIWAVLFYYAIVEEINDETDDSLIEYSDDLIIRKLAGRELPSDDNGTNNTYYIKEVSKEHAGKMSWIDFEYEEVFITAKQELESARVLTRIFRDKDDRYYELKVAVPTFEKFDVQRSIFWWIASLYLILLISVLSLSVSVVNHNMKPFKAMLDWLDRYSPGKHMPPLPGDTNVSEFRRLSAAIGNAVTRIEDKYSEQRRFIGNASHELQTPLAVCSNRIEMLLDSEDLSETQAAGLAKVHNSLQDLIRLNKTLLMLTKIENGQFVNSRTVNFRSVMEETVSMFGEIYASRDIRVVLSVSGDFEWKVDEQLAAVMVRNLLKNAFVHSPVSSDVYVAMDSSGFFVSNPGNVPLDADKVFTRFYTGRDRKEGSTGIGLAIVSTICKSCGLCAEYSFSRGMHVFSIKIQKER